MITLGACFIIILISVCGKLLSKHGIISNIITIIIFLSIVIYMIVYIKLNNTNNTDNSNGFDAL